MKISYYNGSYVDDEEMTVNYKDRAVYFGDGVYEVVRVYDGEFFTLDEHVERLLNSASEVDIGPLDKDEMLNIISNIKEKNQIDNGAVYIQVSRGVEMRNHSYSDDIEPVVMAYINEATRAVDQHMNGVKAVTAFDYRWLKCHIKSLNLLANVLEKQRAVKQGAQETIMHRDGTVTEGASTNIFILKNDVLITHPANHLILNGITRQVVIQLAKDYGIIVEEAPFTVEDLYDADEVFFTSTTQEITPIVQVDDHMINNGGVGNTTLKLQELFDTKINKLNPVK